MTLSRFALHLGFPTPDAPLFDALVESRDPLDHIAFAAEQGFGGVVDPFAAMREPRDQARIGEAAARHGLGMGSFLYVPFDGIGRARWAASDADARARVLADVREAVAIARRLGSRMAAVLSVAEEGVAPEAQRAAMADTLQAAGDLAGAAGLSLCVEGVNRQRLPQMLLHGISASADVVVRAAHPAVRLLFDTGHAAAMGEDVALMLERHRLLIGAVQIADHPGRVEMGAGTIDFSALLVALDRSAPLELEHRWSQPGGAVQQANLDRLRSSG